MQGLRVFLLCFIIVFTLFSLSIASYKTIDADGPADYPSLDSLMSDLRSGKIDPDTIFFIGSNQHTYTWSKDFNQAFPSRIDSIFFINNTITNPDSFPIINNSSGEKYNFFSSYSVSFEGVILTGSQRYSLSHVERQRKFSFRRCVIRDISNAFIIQGSNGSDWGWSFFENCLFEGVTNTVFEINLWGSARPILILMQCTFDGNYRLWNTEQHFYYMWIKNCVFTNNNNSFSTDSLKKRVLYSVVPTPLTGFDPSCVAASDPFYVKSSRTNPSDWQIVSSSSATNSGDTAGAPPIDLGGVVVLVHLILAAGRQNFLRGMSLLLRDFRGEMVYGV